MKSRWMFIEKNNRFIRAMKKRLQPFFEIEEEMEENPLKDYGFRKEIRKMLMFEDAFKYDNRVSRYDYIEKNGLIGYIIRGLMRNKPEEALDGANLFKKYFNKTDPKIEFPEIEELKIKLEKIVTNAQKEIELKRETEKTNRNGEAKNRSE